jgi:enediyne biosynthesis protein E4
MRAIGKFIIREQLNRRTPHVDGDRVPARRQCGPGYIADPFRKVHDLAPQSGELFSDGRVTGFANDFGSREVLRVSQPVIVNLASKAALLAGILSCSVALGQMAGVSTGGIHDPVHDAQHRPITAGGFVEHGTTLFADVTRESGLSGWSHHVGDAQRAYIVESLGSGVALLDYDQDGWLDIYLVNGMTYKALAGESQPPHAALFHNNHDGTFTDVAQKAGVGNDRWGVGAIAGDYNNDGWPDLYVTNVGKNRLYRNNHDGTFTDVAVQAGVALGTWSTGATFGDYDGDGLLDLFVPGYTAYDFNNPPKVGSNSVVSNTCQFRGVSTFCGPRGLKGEQDHLFHNNGDGTFTDVSVKAGVDDKPGYYGLVSLFVDLDDDGKPDLLVGNDSTPNYLYRNKGDGTFEDVSFESGYAVDGQGRETATMGIAVGDYSGSGKLGILSTDFSDDYKVLYRNDGKLSFTDVSAEAGIADVSLPYLSWGEGFLDYDRDGRTDMFIANGHVYPQVDDHDWGTSFAEKPLLFHNMDGTRFSLVEAVQGSGLADVLTARGAAFGDLFNDGRIDVVINNLEGPPALLRNVLKNDNHWIELKLIGGEKVPRDAIGAKVLLAACGRSQRGDVLSGGSFASSSDPRVLFGLGACSSISSLDIIWPDGDKQEIKAEAIDAIVTITQHRGVTDVFRLPATPLPPAAAVNTAKKRP